MNILKIAEEVKKMNMSSVQRRKSKTNNQLQKIVLARIGENINDQIGTQVKQSTDEIATMPASSELSELEMSKQ